jgi:hypothetical protein
LMRSQALPKHLPLIFLNAFLSPTYFSFMMNQTFGLDPVGLNVTD